MKKLINEIETHLNETILPFWKSLKDEEYGGLYGYVDEELKVDTQADKSLIYIARSLWFFSSYDYLYETFEVKAHADSCYRLIRDKFYNQEYGGMAYSVHFDGSVADDTVHVYAVSFAIYGLSMYVKAYGSNEALSLALLLYRLIEDKAFDHNLGMYWEQFDSAMNKIPNTYLSEVAAPYTYNTHLHLLESYTTLYEVSHDSKVGKSLRHLLTLFKERFYHEQCHYIRAYLDERLHEVGCLYSVAHDIEASWLFQEALTVLGIDDEEMQRIRRELIKSASAFVKDGHMNIAYEAGVVDTSNCWWAQAEAMVGFLYAYHDTGDEIYKQLIMDLYAYTKCHFFDPRPNGEWLSGNDENAYIAGPWKAPYHTGRFALQFVAYGRRVEE